ncbi:MAG: hypothetical protein V7767_00635 [Leeuwenhoekiella sp.]
MAEATKLINAFGKMAGWNSITVNIFGRDVEGISEISYDDNISKENIYGAGRMPIGVGEGNYEPTVGLKLYKEEVIAILDSIPQGKRIQDAEPTDVIITYEYKGRIYKDIIRNFQLMKLGSSTSQGDSTVDQTTEAMCSHIDWNVQ